MQAAAGHGSQGGEECACAHETTAAACSRQRSSQRHTVSANKATGRQHCILLTYSEASYGRLCNRLGASHPTHAVLSYVATARHAVKALHNVGVQNSSRINYKHVAIVAYR